MDQNKILMIVLVVSCSLCILYGVVKNPIYFIILLVRGFLCSCIVYAVRFYCIKRGIEVVLDVNFLSIGTGAFLGFPGILALYIIGIFI